MVVDLRLWGKERGLGGACYPVVCHGLDTAAAVRVLWWHVVAPGLRARWATALGMSESEACAVLELWASLHDVGKVTPSFQRLVQIPPGYADDPVAERVAHDRASHVWVPSALESVGYPAQGTRRWSRLVGQLLGGHHGTFHHVEARELIPEGFAARGLGDEQWESQRAAMLAVLSEVLGAPVPTGAPVASAAVIATGLVILADWLASQTDFVLQRLSAVPTQGDTGALVGFFAGSVAEIGDWVDRAGLSRLVLKPGGFEEEFPGFEPNALQRSIATELPGLVTGPGLLMVAAPMGFGKTETALHAARVMGQAAGSAGLVVALPTMATSDQMFGRVARYVARRSQQQASAALAHGMAWLRPVEQMLAEASAAEAISSDEDNQVWSSEWLRGAKRPLLAGAGVATIDQLLLAVLRVRHNALRLFALAGKTVVIDEVHAFTPYMRQLLATLLEWLGEWGVPVVLLSATLPRHVAEELSRAYLGTGSGTGCVVPYPGWVYVERDRPTATVEVEFPHEQRRTVDIALRPVTFVDGTSVDRMPVLREELELLAREGGCAAVICTTVAHAQQTYLDLCEWARSREVDVWLLHSRFPAHQRETITTELTRTFGKPQPSAEGRVDAAQRPRRAIVVATQVIEQSLDVDFDLVVSDLAPIELILQRLGRLQRHAAWNAFRPAWAVPGRGGQQRMVVLTAPDGNLERLPRTWTFIYPKATLVRAHNLLQRRGERGVTIPDDVQDLVDRGNPGDFLDDEDDLVEGFVDAELERSAHTMVERQTAGRFRIPLPHQLRNLSELSEEQIDEEYASTRFNADSMSVLPLFELPDATLHLGSPAGPGLPTPRGNRLSRDQAIAVMRHTIQVPGSLVRGRTDEHRLPEPWRKLWPLRDLIALYHRVDETGRIYPARVGSRSLLLDSALGLTEVT
ncbi:CRISPR-associated helicase Cas3' [Saccharopolyspora thermophila]|uniref:HD Cas3-type domain-containing protein n=1 Tax=Saccharopolyspora thermophila TaxID=89367 RepID=A0ABN1CP88_9PSEU